jgi:hypothetical protein
VGLLVQQAGALATHTRARLDDIIAQWQADKAQLASMANTPAGRVAFLRLGAQRVTEARATIDTAQGEFQRLAGQVQQAIDRLPNGPQVQLLDDETKLTPLDTPGVGGGTGGSGGATGSSPAPGQIGPFPVPKSVEDAAKRAGLNPQKPPVTGDVGGDLGDLLGTNDRPGTQGPGAGGTGGPSGADMPAGLPPVLSQIPPPPDPSVLAQQSARVKAAQDALAAAQAKLNSAAAQTLMQGPGVGPGRDITDPLSQAVFDARRNLSEQTRVMNELNYAAAAAGGHPLPVAPLPENVGVQAFPPPPSFGEQAVKGLSDASHDISKATFGLVPDVAQDLKVFNNWGEHSGAEQTGAVLDAAGMVPLPGAKFLGEGLEHGLDLIGGAAHHVDDLPTPHHVDDLPDHHTIDAPDHPHIDPPPHTHGGGSTYEARLGQTPINNGHWDGPRGESLWTSDNPDVNRYLHDAGVNGIEYHNGYPDFGPVSKGQVEIPNMTTNRDANFRASDIALAEQWGVTRKDVEIWRKTNGYTWHEEPDLKTMQLVPSIVNNRLGHIGGIGELNAGKPLPPR